MERLTRSITPVGMCQTNLNSMKHYMPCVVCRDKAQIKTDSKGNQYTEKFNFCDTCEVKMLFNRLKEYEDAEEQGLLLKPKVALNSFVYWDSGYWGVIPYKVCNISYSIHGFCYEICAFKGDELLDDQEVVDDDFGKYVFLSKEEAEQKLAEGIGGK